MARLRRSNCAGDGIARVRTAQGFRYEAVGGAPVDDEAVLARVEALVIPPAWEDVWICPWANGHIQALGTDAAGRRQYRYHDDWRRHRDRDKFDRMVEFGRSLPALRRTVRRDLAEEGMGRRRVLACATELLDRASLRIGGDQYAEDHETFGLSTLLSEHVRLKGSTAVFDFPAKGSIRRVVEVEGLESFEVLAALKRRRGASRLFAYKERSRWVDVKAEDVNAYLKEAIGEQFSAKDFRTWAATVIAAVALAVPAGGRPSKASTKRAVVAMTKEVAEHLGNTPTVSRSSYIDPRVIDRFISGEVLRVRDPAAASADEGSTLSYASRVAAERAVLALLEDRHGKVTDLGTTRGHSASPSGPAKASATEVA